MSETKIKFVATLPHVYSIHLIIKMKLIAAARLRLHLSIWFECIYFLASWKIIWMLTRQINPHRPIKGQLWNKIFKRFEVGKSLRLKLRLIWCSAFDFCFSLISIFLVKFSEIDLQFEFCDHMMNIVIVVSSSFSSWLLLRTPNRLIYSMSLYIIKVMYSMHMALYRVVRIQME